MAKTKADKHESVIKSRPGLTPESREKQIIALAMDAAERQIKEGTASSQVITHFLKLASEKERLEREKLIEENKLLKAKTESLKSQKKVEELYAEALNAMRNYAGYGDRNEDD